MIKKMKKFVLNGGQVGQKRFKAGCYKSLKGSHPEMRPGVTIEVESLDNESGYPCCNLRPARGGAGGLEATNAVTRVGNTRARRVLARLGDGVILGTDSSGGFVVERPGGNMLAISGSISGEVAGAVTTGHNRAIVTSRDGEFHVVEVTGNVVKIRPGSLRSGITLTAEAAGVYSVGVAGQTLTGSYTTRDVKIGGSDLGVLTKDVGEAYRVACRRALSAGHLPGVAIGRCRVVGKDGMTLMMTPPVLLCSPTAGSHCPEYSTTVDGSGGRFNVVREGELRVTGLSVSLSTPAGLSVEELAAIDHVDVLMTPVLTPVAIDGVVEGQLTDFQGTECRLRVSIPGVTLGGGVAASRHRIVGALARLSRMETTVARVQGDALRSGKVTIYPSYGRQFERCIKMVDSVLGEDIREVNRSVGSRWHGEYMTRIGEMILSANITRRPASSYTPLQLSCQTASGSGNWRGYCSVEVADGDGAQRVVTEMTGSSGRPLSLGALVVYPGGNGRKLTARISGTAGRIELPLEPSGDGSFSYYLSEDLGPIVGSEDATPFIVPTEEVVETHYGGCVLMSSQREPGSVVAETEVDGEVTALVEAVNGGSTLDFGRSRCYLMSTSGIYSLAVNSRGDRVKTDLIDCRGVGGERGVSVSEDHVEVLAGGDLVKLSGSRTTTAVRGVEGVAVGRTKRFGETWIVGDDGVTVVTSSGFYRRDDLVPEFFMETERGTLAVDSKGDVYNPEDEQEGVWSGPIHWSIYLEDAEAGGEKRLKVDMTEAGRDLRLKLWHNGREKECYRILN